MGNNRLQLNPGKAEWLWVLRHLPSLLGDGTVPFLVQDGIALLQKDLLHNLGVLLESSVEFSEQVAVLTRRTFTQLCFVCQLRLFLDQRALTHGHSCPDDLRLD